MARPRLFTDDEILAATQSCIFEHGPGVSTTTIAERAGTSQAVLFKRFGTKEKLIIRALRQPMQRNPVSDLLRKGPEDGPIRPQLIGLGITMIGMMRRMVPCLAMLHAAGLGSDHENALDDSPAIRVRSLLVDWFQHALDDGRIRGVNPHIIAVGFLGMLHERPFRETIVRDTELTCTDEEYVTEVVDSLLFGIAASEEP
ncbi:MAG: TetR/AcrR family transcriptional regulator [Myxococcota bacterium]|nr:TetR/AcrR family transcriptional regulator [Myxococcota bacterium]MEC9390074.1 TetR/AcrR family transcriptional regulator [Myxococcota bacterium]